MGIMSTIEKLTQQAIELLTQSRHVVALTGAGISTPSGIPDFRSPDSGVWRNTNPMDVATIYAFRHRPQAFYDWIRPLAKLTLSAQPNAAHLALAEMEACGLLKCVITQNIDMLHTRAGSQTIYEVHGHLRQATCLRCYHVYEAAPIISEFVESGLAPHCTACGGVLKPNVILFGEQLPIRILQQAQREAKRCDLMLVAGSSLEVAPAGDLPLLASQHGARLIFVNYEATHLDPLADVCIHADVVDVLPKLAAAFPPGRG
jgi:NAD-dependent deacetylase